MVSENKILGIDIGGTKISLGIIANGEIEHSIQLKTPAEGTQEEVIQEIIKGIESIPGYENIIGIGIGAPGLIDEKEGIIFSVNNIASWKEVHLKEHLSNYFKKPVYITNDANCFAIGVKIYGEGKKYSNLVGLSLGTGVGAGIIIDNYLYSGQVSCAGELGGLPYRDHDFETYCSGKFFKTFYGIKGDEAFKKAQKNDGQALAMFENLGIHIGNLIKTTLFVMAPQAVIIGGSVSKSYKYWEKSMWQTIHTFPYKKALENFVVEPSTISNMSVIGAVALFKNRYEKETVKLSSEAKV